MSPSKKRLKEGPAAVYVRVSTTDQEAGTSLDTQRSQAIAKANQDGFDVPSDLVFKDVMSGKRADRPGFERLKQAARDGVFKQAYVWAVDRFGRDLRSSVNAVADLKEAGVRVISVKEGDLDNQVVFAVLSAVADGEHRRIKERTLPAKLAKRDAGYWVVGRPPYGYRIRTDKTLEICPEEARVVRRIFTEAVSGLGRVHIARRLNADRILPPEVRQPKAGSPSKYGRSRLLHTADSEKRDRLMRSAISEPEWQSSTVAKILRNTMAYGELNDRPIKIHPAPIISRPEFEATRRSMKSRIRAGKKSNPRWLLAGLLKCACGSTYRRHQGAPRSDYYVCTARKAGKKCQGPYIRAERAEEDVIRAVRRFFDDLTPEYLSEFLVDMTEAQMRKQQLAVEELNSRRRTIAQDLEAAQNDFSEARRLGVAAEHLPSYADRIGDAGRALQSVDRELRTLHDELIGLSDTDRLSSEEIREAVRQLETTLQLRTYERSPSGELEAEDLTDPYPVLHAVVNTVMVNLDGTLSIELCDRAQDQTRLHRLLTDLARREVEFVKDISRMKAGRPS